MLWWQLRVTAVLVEGGEPVGLVQQSFTQNVPHPLLLVYQHYAGASCLGRSYCVFCAHCANCLALLATCLPGS
jgi:formate hydrogenlyase subunit 6/NADH:ubiquinone oxidoreductase subunit I